ncbi:hypothetical protein NQ315_004442 [Exocentrus adspersus]|uniref:Methenyltetrahydrofolate cyclohydrolase n=1 Tax=Exocentrus adspersus TaxID=1586481 RepID=A0AAV8VAM2_9CUCU|nr:hypothetical protein NQ315_004442 [Exocentrus adspersus]
MDGKEVAVVVQEKIKKQTAEWIKRTGQTPKLTAVVVGKNAASQFYVRSKKKAAMEVGFISEIIELPAKVTEVELLACIKELNQDVTVHGILVQLPLPQHIDEHKVICQIDVYKDVDGFHPEQVGALSIGLNGLAPCTPAGIIELLKYYKIKISGKHAVVIGRSNIVGKPIANMLLKLDATVTITHSQTQNLAEITRGADILIVSIGQPHFLTADLVKEGAVVIDVGINRTEAGKLIGDVDFEGVKEKVFAITPVPGGVGPMTISMLLDNTLVAFKRIVSVENKEK